MSYNTKFIISAAAVLALTATACHREELRLTPAPASSLVLTAGLPEFETQLTKSGSVTADSLFAYPYWENMTGPSEAVRNNNFSDGRYYFLIPSEASGIVFTSISEYAEGIKVTPAPAPEILLEFASDTGSCFGHDLIYGSIADYDATAAEQSIRMKRAVARITPTLCHIIGEDTVATSLNTFYDSVSLTLGGIYQGARIDTVSLTASYFGSDSFSLPFNVTGEACTMNGFYTLPSAEGTPSVSLDLLMTGSSEPVRISAPLPEPILANRDYNMTFYLHRDNMEGNISLSVEVNEIIKNVSVTDSFDLIEFSSRSLVFDVDAGSTAELTVYSKIGSWSATIPAEVLSYYTVANSTSGDTATVESPTITGHSGDVVTFKTLSNISDHEVATIFSIPFSAEPNNTYELTVMQSNGQMEEIEIVTASNSTATISQAGGVFSIYRTDGAEQELIATSDGQLSDTHLPEGGKYLISGYYIESLNIDSPSAVRLLNAPSLSSLSIYYYSASEGIDMSGTHRLTSLSLRNNELIREIDLSAHTMLTSVNFSLSGLERLLLSDCTALTSVELNNVYSSLRYVNISGCTSLKTLTQDLSQLVSYVDSLDISRSGIEDVYLNYNKTEFTYFKLDHCASLKTFYNRYGTNADTLDFTGCTALDSVYIEGNTIPLSNVILDGCTALRSVRLNQLSNLENLSLESASVENLYLDQLPKIQNLTFDGYDIRNLYIGQQNGCEALEVLSMNNSTLRNLYMNNNSSLISLSLSGCTSLEDINITNSDQLNLLFLDGCSAVTFFKIWNSSNSQLPAPDMSQFPELENLLFCYLANVSRLDLSTNTKLKEIHLNYLSKLDRLDLRTNTELKEISLNYLNSLTNLNCEGLSGLQTLKFGTAGSPDTLILNGCSSIQELKYGTSGSHYLKHFESAGMTSLRSLSLTNLSLPEINLELPSLETLTINENSGRQSASVLKKVYVSEGNQLRKVSITGTDYLNIEDIELNARNTLTSLNIYDIYYGTSPAASYDLSDYTKLDTLSIRSCSGLQNLNLSGCTSLTLADFDNSGLHTLDLTGCDNLRQLDLYSNEFTGDELDAVLTQLPALELSDGAKYRIAGCPGAGSCNIDIAKQKHWALVTADIDSGF